MSNIEVPEGVRVWKIGRDSANVQSWNNYTHNQGYNLFCQSNGQYLIPKEQPLGITVDFTSNTEVFKTHFRLPDGAEKFCRENPLHSVLAEAQRSYIIATGMLE